MNHQSLFAVVSCVNDMHILIDDMFFDMLLLRHSKFISNYIYHKVWDEIT